jgi:hypothetical protein
VYAGLEFIVRPGIAKATDCVDARLDSGWLRGRLDDLRGRVGGASLHNCFTSHGPDRETYDRASTVELKPHKPMRL